MSFRELRNFTESMKALGYPRSISVENFRSPNFELVADALYWLVHRYDPTAEVDENISSESARVEFLKSVAVVMMSKARVKLNIKQLYRADGYAVKELLKISSLLYDAISLDSGAGDAASEAEVAKSQASADVSLASKLEELKEARNLATDIVESGSKLFGLLGRESELKESRDRALMFLDSISLNLGSDDPHSMIEQSIREQVSLLSDNLNDLSTNKDDAQKTVATLRSKIERRVTELERAEKRLKSLRKVKPAFSDEYEQLEGELKGLYEAYLERFRNMHFLEHELGRYHLAEREKKAESDKQLKRMQKKLREEELRILRGDQPVDENAIDQDDGVYDSNEEDEEEERSDDDGEEEDQSDDDDRRGGGKRRGAGGGGTGARPSAGGRPGAAGRSVVGSMAGGHSDSSDAEGSEDSDNDSDGAPGGGGGGGKSDLDSGSDLGSDDADSDDDRPKKPVAGRNGTAASGMERDRGALTKAPGGPSGRAPPKPSAASRKPADDESDEPSDDGSEDDEDETF